MYPGGTKIDPGGTNFDPPCPGMNMVRALISISLFPDSRAVELFGCSAWAGSASGGGVIELSLMNLL